MPFGVNTTMILIQTISKRNVDFFDLSVSNVAFSGEKSAVTLIFPAFQYSDRLYMGGLVTQIRQQQSTPRITADQSGSKQIIAGHCRLLFAAETKKPGS